MSGRDWKFFFFGIVMGGLCDQPHIHSATYTGGAVLVSEGDWIVADPDGIHYDIMKPEVFEKTYIQVGG